MRSFSLYVNCARTLIHAPGKKALDCSVRRAHYPALPQFFLLSLTLHLFLLTGPGKSENVMPKQRLGQPELKVQLQDAVSAHISRAPSNIHSPPEKVALNPRSSGKTAEYASVATATASIPHESTAPNEQPPIENMETDIHNQLLGELQTNLSRYLVYPPLARSRGWEGTVLLGLQVASDGRLDKIRVEHSSGYAVLDNSALNSLYRLGRLAEASTWLNGRGQDMQLPVIYRLIDN
ncbi:MAG: TonB family protein [Gammaproteobacteria bacterium]|nr:TonB family protein [Gammaproteobacteria bacterium]